jgi:hypothetical protein
MNSVWSGEPDHLLQCLHRWPTTTWCHRTVQWWTGPIRCRPGLETAQSNPLIGATGVGPVCTVPVRCLHRVQFFGNFYKEGAIAPRPLGTIKGTPRRLHLVLKHLKCTSTLWNSAIAPSSDLREIRAPVLSCSSVILYSRSCLCFLCVCCCVVLLCACHFSLPYSSLDCDHLCKAMRDSNLWSFLRNEILI